MFAREREMKPIVADWLRAQGLVVRSCETYSPGGYPDLVGCSLDPVMVDRRQRRHKGWRPLHTRLLAVELKLTRIAEALRQAESYQQFFGEALVAFPVNVVLRVPHRDGIGVLAVSPYGCRLLIPSVPRVRQQLQWSIESQVEKFWRERKKLTGMALPEAEEAKP
jgi:hypothetical protein